ncbi:ATP-binding cassette domain-containing protein [Amycolatopsis acidiphila]|uniref:ATP-binding cassette domain-containing protein n=1 Tax=Amycolatopsis acidiphila TaxID=715473 RepID=A0A558AP60_9PSEU|nr:branched-chain amino acid ABC transporter permease/ATP-binding protein [Amycolatopsis acidiphila]TVT26053.1 ATP-binding cassette domain-containing protein [Amycolatopsis acidiphila]UIJ63225.1 ATP-binding cassette domain-containing protein [Amycolatopsis acidiphila]GHG74456.1 ABC transporter [Amycolatopsis acidiphila]
MTHLVFLLLGLGNGAVFGALALALVLTYRSSGVLNFGTSAIALHAAYVYAFLRQGKLLLLVPGLPVSVDIGDPLSFIPALIVTLVVSSLFGLVLYVLIFRPLRTAPPVAKAVAALGVSLVVSGIVAERLGTTPVAVKPIFPTELWKFGTLRMSSDRIYFALTILVVAALLGLVFRYTRFGLATRASAESERGAYLSGVSPDRVAAYNWMLSSAIAGLSGILIAPIVPLVPLAYTLFIVPALAAAILARFQLVFVAAAAGLVIGMLQSETQYLQTHLSWLPKSGLPELVPLVLILLVLVVRARPLPTRGALILRTLGRAPRPRLVIPMAVLGVIVVVAALFVLQDRFRAGLIVSLIMAIIALSVVVVSGYAGQLSLAQLTLAGAAGFVLGPLGNDLHLPFPLAPLLAAVAAAVLGVVIGLPALRIRGLTVAVVTLALAFALEAFWFRNLDFVSSSGVAIPEPELFGWDLGIGAGLAYPRVTFGILCLLVLVVVAMGVAWLRRSGLGSQMLAIRANERAAAAAGVNVVRVKIVVFAIAAFIAGLGGALLAYQQRTITYDAFSAVSGLSLFATVYLAGITSISGGILAGFCATGGLVFIIVDEVVGTGGWYVVVSSVLLILTVIMNPEGIVGPAHQKLAAVRAKRETAVAPVESPPEPVPLRSEKPGRADLLSVRGLGVHYGGVVAVDDVTFDVAGGTIVGLIGPNGAGKTTLLDAVSGFAEHTGTVVLDGRSLEDLAPHERVRAGLGRTFQALELYDDLSVEENVAVGLTASHGRRERPPEEALRRVFSLLDLASLRTRPAGELSQGQRQLVSIARALVGQPRVLLLDEPAGGLDTAESTWLGERLKVIRDSGVTIIMVDHDMGLVLSLCDEVRVLNFGKVIAAGTPAEIRADREVAAAYLGSTPEAATA